MTPAFSLHAGPQVAFLAKGEDEYELEGDTGTEELEDTKGLDFGLAAGEVYQLNMGVFFNARYNLGLTNIWDVEGESDFSQQNSVFQLLVGYMF